MTSVRRRAVVVVAATALAAAMTMWAPPAHAACTTLPVSTPGTTVRIAGEDHRVPAISNVSICTSDGSVPFVWVETSGGFCTTACLSIGLAGSDADAGSVTISFRADGNEVSRTVSPGGVGGPGDACLLSVGSPQAPRPDCPNAVSVDDVIGDPVGDVVAIVEGLIGDVPSSCDEIPDQRDPNSGETVAFCDDPSRWLDIFLNRTCERFCDGEELMRIVCLQLSRLGFQCA
ncbi:MAG: hypothetical protein M3279_11660 [Actinomycetota bacterium]|nr:hypothetical protein [Actinomycetota bacterium]